ncbi:MAG: hypothetical protein JJK57_15725 [Komagataeibacter hansenii]|nr:hypothetical protein [Novacetimonas hansenii]
MDRTTSAEILEHVFLKFSSFLPETNGTNHNILYVWGKVFNTEVPVSQNDVYKRIIEVSETVNILSTEIQESTIMKENQKKFSLSTLSVIEPVTRIININHQAQPYIPKITNELCGQLGMIHYSLVPEFSQNPLSQDAADEIIGELSVVYDQLNDENIPIKLRVRLRRSILSVISRLKNVDVDNIYDIYEEIGKITLTACEMDRMYKKSDDSGKMAEIGRNLLSSLNKVRNCIEFGYKLYNSAQGLEETIKPLIE